MKYLNIKTLSVCLILVSCNNREFEYDASGIFEATETIVSAETTGKIEELNIREGDNLEEGQMVGYIDTMQLYLKKRQLQASVNAVENKKPNVAVQLSALREQIQKAEFEKQRIENLLKDGAGTQKQLDDVNSQIAVLNNTFLAQSGTLSNSVNSIHEEAQVYAIQIEQIDDMLKKSRIINPLAGTVLYKYAMGKEIAVPGKALYKIADTRLMSLRVYVVSAQLNNIKLGQDATVFVQLSDGESKSYPAKVTWISDKAEFTPKTIQTKDERQNLVYAVKLEVKNTDGLIKIGMYGDISFK
ncbi:MAG: efflux RND transporter periplasmic adaptor subunit [Tannerella sp.]|jgi:HlyD family secretion protein|nr:efflux RND transporter periplasmic adaptor subunit [Tannerella sp.]